MLSRLLSVSDQAVDDLHSATALYTASHIIDSLLDRLDWPNCRGRLLDPSAGDGAFLLQALKRLDLSDSKSIERIQGWEIHPGAAAEAQNRIASYLEESGFDQVNAQHAAKKIVVNKDFLTEGPDNGQFQIIAGNPPYLRFQRLPDDFKILYGTFLPPHTRGDLLHAFLDSCSQLIHANGAVGLVCSDRFLFNCTAADLREQLGTRVGISHLRRLDQSTAFYRPKNRIKNSPPRIHPVEIVFHPSQRARFPITREPISPDNLTTTRASGPTLSTIAKVSIAPWLGPFGIFVVTRDKAEEFIANHAELIPAVDTDDIDPQTDELRTPTRYAIFTKRDETPAPIVTAHLQEFRGRMPPRGQRSQYWMPPETINLALDQPSLLIPRIARRIRAIELPAGILPINHNLSVISSSDRRLNEIKNLLLSDQSQQWIRTNAPRLESGYYSITTRLLRRLPI